MIFFAFKIHYHGVDVTDDNKDDLPYKRHNSNVGNVYFQRLPCFRNDLFLSCSQFRCLPFHRLVPNFARIYHARFITRGSHDFSRVTCCHVDALIPQECNHWITDTFFFKFLCDGTYLKHESCLLRILF